MMCSKHFHSALALAGILSIASVSAETAAPETGADTKTKALEERVRVLEKRLADMEARLGQFGQMNQMGQAAPPTRRFEMNPNNPDDIFERMRREMDNGQGTFDWDNLFGQNSAPKQLRGLGGRKPCLGVGVETASDELKERFKNEVKEGAFVMSVYPNSAAEKAGITVGDAITSFDGKPMTDSAGVIDAVKAAGKGSHEIVVSRRGESLMMKVELSPETSAAMLEDLLPPARGGEHGNGRTRTEIKVSALELSDDLAKDLKLNDDQKKKVSDVLSKHSRALSTEFNESSKAQRRGGLFGLPGGNVNELAKKHSDEAAKDLAAVLDADQLKKWNDYRASHSSVSMSQTMQSGPAGLGGKRFDLEPQEKQDEPDRF